jgi:hypothetical protein
MKDLVKRNYLLEGQAQMFLVLMKPKDLTQQEVAS